jgi:hypothetical protein
MNQAELRTSIYEWSQQMAGVVFKEAIPSGRAVFELTWHEPSGAQPYIAVVPEAESLIIQHGVTRNDGSRCVGGTLHMSLESDVPFELSRLKRSIEATVLPSAPQKEWYAAVPPLIKTATLKF